MNLKGEQVVSVITCLHTVDFPSLCVGKAVDLVSQLAWQLPKVTGLRHDRSTMVQTSDSGETRAKHLIR